MSNINQDDDYYIITKLKSNKVLDVNNDASPNNVTIWDKLSGDNQKWRFEYVSSKGAYKIISKANNQVLAWNDYQGSNNVFTTPFVAGYDEHYWVLEPISDGYYIFKNYKNQNLVLDVSGANTNNGANVIVYKNIDANNQKFKLTKPLGEWMSFINGDKKLSQISIPGTHESGALYEPIINIAKCQTLSISEQLKIGVRYLDIRCRHIGEGFTIHHGIIYQKMVFGEVLNQCRDFLSANPTETIIMSIKEEHTPENTTKSFYETFLNYYNRDRNLWLMTDRIPTLNEARGKIVLLRRFNGNLGLNASYWPDNRIFTERLNSNEYLRVQDKYKVSNKNDKWNDILVLYSESVENNSGNTLYLNYSSGYTSVIFGIPNIPDVSGYINPKLVNYFKTAHGNHGVTAMDFVNRQLTQGIINLNNN